MVSYRAAAARIHKKKQIRPSVIAAESGVGKENRTQIPDLAAAAIYNQNNKKIF